MTSMVQPKQIGVVDSVTFTIISGSYKAFTTAGKKGSALEHTLEYGMIPIIFHVRNDSDVLYSHYKINLQGVQDLQLMELATRPFTGTYISGLANCIKIDLSFSPGEKTTWQDTKQKGRRLFAPELGGSYKVLLVYEILLRHNISHTTIGSRKLGIPSALP
ncbi:hypothetical protein SCUP515_05379 [Seiridium cupressi]